MKRILPALLIVAVAIAAGWFLLRGASRESPIIDEPPHITAGYTYLHFQDYRLNPEHPPFTKVVSAVFLLGRPISFPLDNPAWQQDVNGQWTLNAAFLYGSGNGAQDLVAEARRGPVLITLVLILGFAWWTGKRLGPWWGVLGAAFLGLSPFILGHGNLVTTDIAAALGAFTSIVTFGRYLEQPSWKRGLVAGIAFGFAQLCKFSLVLLAPTYLIAGILFLFFRHPWQDKWISIWQGLKKLLLVAVIGFALIVYPTYYALTKNYPAARQVRDSAYLLGSFAGGITLPGELCRPVRCAAEAVIWGAGIPFLRPAAHYFLGVLMVVQRSAGGSTNYFLGSVSSAGSPLYFPVVYLFKETLPLLGLLAGAVAYASMRYLRHRPRKPLFATWGNWIAERPLESLMAAFIILYWASSIESSLNIGVRHLMPVIPLMYFLALRTWKRWHDASRPRVRRFIAAALMVFAAGQAVTAVHASPYFLPYYNPLAGGTKDGYRYATDSNYDWGQDLIALREWLDSHPEAGKIAVTYFGGGDIHTYLGDRAVSWYGNPRDPREEGIRWFATSVSFLQTGIQPAVRGEERRPEQEYHWLTNERPRPPGMGTIPPYDARAGVSMLIYRLP